MFDIRKYNQIMVIQLFFKIRITTKNNFCEILFSKEKIWPLIFTFCHSANHKKDQQNIIFLQEGIHQRRKDTCLAKRLHTQKISSQPWKDW